MSLSSRKKFDTKLIELVRGYPILYDLRKRKKQDRLRMQRIWKKIASDMKCNPLKCQTRWHSIRDYYTRMQKLKTLGKAPKSKFFVYNLRFLETQLKNKRSPKKIKREPQSSTSSKDSVEYDKNKEVISNNEYPKMLNCEVVLQEDVDTLIQAYAKTAIEIKQDEGPKNKRLEVSEKSTGISNEHEEERLQIIPRSSDEKSSTDEIDAFETVNPVFTFFKSMAQIVAQFPPRYITEARIGVCQCVGDIEARVLSEKNELMASAQNILKAESQLSLIDLGVQDQLLDTSEQ